MRKGEFQMCQFGVPCEIPRWTGSDKVWRESFKKLPKPREWMC